MRWLTAAALAAAVAFAGTAEAATERRVALVIGNSAYEHAPALGNPRNDAAAIADAFERLDFEVVKGFDLTNTQMRDTIHTFAKSLEKVDVAAFYYAGHGIQVDGRNFLIPVDAELKHEADLAFNAVDAKLVIDQMMRESKVKLIMLDACRDNPLAQSLASRLPPTRSAAVGRGLAKIENVQGTLIAFATEPGSVAYDGSGSHSPFTEALLKHVETPKTEINVVMTRVRGDVFRSTREKQLPWVNVSLTNEFYLNPRSVVAAEQAEAAEVQVATVEPKDIATDAPGVSERVLQSWEVEKALWDAVDAGGTHAEYEAYLAEYPKGRFAAVAKVRIAHLKRMAETAKTADANAESGNRGQEQTTGEPPALKVANTAGQADATEAEQAVDPEAAEIAEEELDLDRDERRSVQRRLTLLGHETHGVDGIFGPNTRAAVEGWQSENEFVATGFLDEDQHDKLIAESEDAYTKWAAAAARDSRQRAAAAAAAEAERKAAAKRTARKKSATRSAKAKSAPRKKKTARRRAAAPSQQDVARRAPPPPPPPGHRSSRRIKTVKHGDKVFVVESPQERQARRQRRRHRTGAAFGAAAGIGLGIGLGIGFGR